MSSLYLNTKTYTQPPEIQTFFLLLRLLLPPTQIIYKIDRILTPHVLVVPTQERDLPLHDDCDLD